MYYRRINSSLRYKICLVLLFFPSPIDNSFMMLAELVVRNRYLLWVVFDTMVMTPHLSIAVQEIVPEFDFVVL